MNEDDWESWHERAFEPYRSSYEEQERLVMRVRERVLRATSVAKKARAEVEALEELEVPDHGMGQNVASLPATEYVNVATSGTRVDL